MIIKEIDKKEHQIQILEKLLNASSSEKQKALIEKDLKNLKNGYESEKQNAYMLDFYLKDKENFLVIHDLRLEYKDYIAQIDHILITRVGIEIVESKSFKGEVFIKSDNSLEVRYGRNKYSFPNPIEQAKRHEYVVKNLLDAYGLLRNQIGKKFDISSYVVFHNQTIVKNNPLPVGFSKADSFIRERDDEISKTGILKSFKLVSGIRTAESIRKIADFLVSQHTPITYDYEKKYKIGKEKSETKNKNEAVNTEDDETKASLINASKAEDINTTIENPQAPKAIIKEGDPCPRCKKGKLVIREVKSKKYKEKYQHEKFLGCENYPKCRYASSIC